MDLREHSHNRLNALTGEWVLVSPNRMLRPWQGRVENTKQETQECYSPTCYLCPTNQRANGNKNPDYDDTFVFDNDFSALTTHNDSAEVLEHETLNELLTVRLESGICRVICYSPRHDLTLGNMSVRKIENVIGVWNEQATGLGAFENIQYVQIFENRGEMMGCSNPHPHGQIWASSSIPQEIHKELSEQKIYLKRHGRELLLDYAEMECDGERMVYGNNDFVCVVPFWAVWPFEILIIPKKPHASLATLTAQERLSLAEALKQIIGRYDSLFSTPFPYSMGLHIDPCDDCTHSGAVFHIHFYPPLLRSATVRKFLVGYEMLAIPQRDLTAEEAAKQLRTVSI